MMWFLLMMKTSAQQAFTKYLSGQAKSFQRHQCHWGHKDDKRWSCLGISSLAGRIGVQSHFQVHITLHLV